MSHSGEIIKHNEIKRAAAMLRAGQILIFPTDTVWGFGTNGQNAASLDKIRQIKGKSAAAPMLWLLPSVQAVEQFCGQVTPAERRLLLTKHTSVIIHGQGIRVIKSGWLNKLLTACGVPIVSTSANRHGAAPIQSWRAAAQQFGKEVDGIVRGKRIFKNRPSRVVAVNPDGTLKVLRETTIPAGRGISIK